MDKKYETPMLEEVTIKVEDVMVASGLIKDPNDGGTWTPVG